MFFSRLIALLDVGAERWDFKGPFGRGGLEARELGR